MIKHKLILFLLLGHLGFGQTKISGSVKTKKQEAVIGASITLLNTYDGAIADTSGKFNFVTYEKGIQKIEIKSIGYKPMVQEINCDQAEIQLNVILIEQINKLDAVVVTAGAFEASDTKKSVAVLNSIDMATTGGSNADPTKAINTLPGAQRVGEQEGLFVRGGTSAETKQYIDGTMVPNPFTPSVPNIASRSRFSAFLFKGTVFATGGYSALYGQAMSSALIMESIDMPEKSQGAVFIAPILANVGYQHLSKNKNYSWGINAGYTHLGAYFKLVSQTPDYFKMPIFSNYDANFRIRTKNGMIKFYSAYSVGDIGLRRPDIDSLSLKNAFEINNKNFYNNLTWKENLKNNWKLYLGLSYSTNTDNISQELVNADNKAVLLYGQIYQSKTFSVYQPTSTSQARIVLEKRLKNISALRFGAENWYSINKTRFENNQVYQNNLKDNFTSIFAETDTYISNDLVAKTGLRFEYSSLLKKSNIAPRISMAYKIKKGLVLSTAYGQFYQKPEDIYLFRNQKMTFTKATHYIANIQKFDAFHTLRVETFYKKYSDLVKYNPSLPAVYDNKGNGYAKGMEIFWRDKKTFKEIEYWFSYSLLDTKRNYLNFGSSIQPNFAAKHTANLVVKKFVTKWRTGFNATYAFATGRPYYFISNNGIGVEKQGTTANYNSLDLSLNYLPNLGKGPKKSFIVLIASASNVLSQKQIYGYNFNHDASRMQAISVPAQHFYFVGCMISFGTDRTQDAINNNL